MSDSESEPRLRFVSAFEEWSVDRSGHVVTVAWDGSPYAVAVGLNADEDQDEVRLTAWYEERPMSPSTAGGFQVRRMKSAMEHVASVRLRAPLGNRRVVDCERPDEPQVPRRRPPAWLRQTAIWNLVLSYDGAKLVSFEHEGHDHVDITVSSLAGDAEAIKAAIQREHGPGIRVHSLRHGPAITIRRRPWSDAG